MFRSHLSLMFSKIPRILERVQKLKIGAVETELERIVETSGGKELRGEVTLEEIKSAARVEVQSRNLEEDDLLGRLAQLSIEYDTVRNTMPAGRQRTTMMTRVLAQMRVLGPSLIRYLDNYKRSTTAGGRLVAIAMMQMDPRTADLPWLVQRFREDAPFIFYHAALAMANAAHDANRETREMVKAAASEALAILNGFDGEPDQNSLMVLGDLLQNL